MPPPRTRPSITPYGPMTCGAVVPSSFPQPATRRMIAPNSVAVARMENRIVARMLPLPCVCPAFLANTLFLEWRALITDPFLSHRARISEVRRPRPCHLLPAGCGPLRSLSSGRGGGRGWPDGPTHRPEPHARRRERGESCLASSPPPILDPDSSGSSTAAEATAGARNAEETDAGRTPGVEQAPGISGTIRPMIHLGTSGYSFRDWVGNFYPPGIPQGQMLNYYAQRF